jgi:hypothetical protein
MNQTSRFWGVGIQFDSSPPMSELDLQLVLHFRCQCFGVEALELNFFTLDMGIIGWFRNLSLSQDLSTSYNIAGTCALFECALALSW